MEKELGKWILDVAKFVATAVIISNLFSDMQGGKLLVAGISCVAVMLIIGLLLTRDKKDKNKS